MTSTHRAETAAESITAILRQEYKATIKLTPPPEAAALPLGPDMERYVLVVNIHISLPRVSLPLLWELTVPLIRHLSETDHLAEFWSITVQVSARFSDGNFDRVLRVECLTHEVGSMQATRPLDLLEPDILEKDRFFCHWYWDIDRFRGQT